MLIKTIKYEDLDGNEITEKFYFRLTEAEALEWFYSNQDSSYIDTLKDFIYRSFGEKSIDNRTFVKDYTKRENFMNSEAYSNLFMELIGNEESANEFIYGVLPKKLVDKIHGVLESKEEKK